MKRVACLCVRCGRCKESGVTAGAACRGVGGGLDAGRTLGLLLRRPFWPPCVPPLPRPPLLPLLLRPFTRRAAGAVLSVLRWVADGGLWCAARSALGLTTGVGLRRAVGLPVSFLRLWYGIRLLM